MGAYNGRQEVCDHSTSNDLAIVLLGQLVQNSPDKNVFISPLSIRSVLCVAEAGTTEDSEHFQALQKFLQRFGRPASTSAATIPVEGDGCKLLCASSIWSREGIHQEYKDQAA